VIPWGVGWDPPQNSPQAAHRFQQYWGQPVLGTCGFNFGWKNYDRIAEVTAACGWALVILSNNATEEDIQRWRRKNPYLFAKSGFLSTSEIVSHLAGCDATAFCYECANSGTSGAIRLGLAARKPVIAFSSCRQFRDLQHLDRGMHWCGGFQYLRDVLSSIPIQRCDPGIVAQAEEDSWVKLGQRYAVLYQGLLA
jgi:hypothetical protein